MLFSVICFDLFRKLIRCSRPSKSGSGNLFSPAPHRTRRCRASLAGVRSARSPSPAGWRLSGSLSARGVLSRCSPRRELLDNLCSAFQSGVTFGAPCSRAGKIDSGNSVKDRIAPPSSRSFAGLRNFLQATCSNATRPWLHGSQPRSNQFAEESAIYFAFAGSLVTTTRIEHFLLCGL